MSFIYNPFIFFLFIAGKVPAQELTSPPFIQKVVREINQRIKVYDMMIRSATCEVTGEKFYVFLVTIEKPIMKLVLILIRIFLCSMI